MRGRRQTKPNDGHLLPHSSRSTYCRGIPAPRPVPCHALWYELRPHSGNNRGLVAQCRRTHTHTHTHGNILAPVPCPPAPALGGNCSARTHPPHTRCRPHSRASLDTVVRFSFCMICKDAYEESCVFFFLARACRPGDKDAKTLGCAIDPPRPNAISHFTLGRGSWFSSA